MSEMFQGFLACAGAALFLGAMLAAVKSIMWRSVSPCADEASGAQEGDQIHFRMAEDPATRATKPIGPAK
jgi:hypothetical protein